MNTLSEIQKKITTLGGVGKNPSCKDDMILEVQDSFLLKLEKKLGNKLPDSYISTLKFFGPFSFQKQIKIKCQDVNPVADGNNKVTVDYFYGLSDKGECSISKLLKTYSNQLPDYLLPICDGESGDLICMDFRQDTYENIYYWFHEAEEGNDLFLISKSFVEFISKLEISEEIEEDKEENAPKAEIKISDKLLEMLKKSGYGPKE
jgi:hypothetical protein